MSNSAIHEQNQKLLWALTTIESLEIELKTTTLALEVISQTANVMLRKPILETRECRGTVGVIAATALEALRHVVVERRPFDEKPKML